MTRLYKGLWSEVEPYVVNDVVLNDYKFYLALQNNTNSEPANGNWEALTAISNLCYIIQEKMGIANDRIFIYNQDFKVPQVKGLFIVIQYNSSEVMSNTARIVGEEDSMKEELTLLTKENLTINLMSKDDSARLRKEEVFFALSSTFAEQQQEIYNIKIAELSSSFTNVSELEGEGMLNRFAIDISLFSWFKKENPIEFYDTFTNNTIAE